MRISDWSSDVCSSDLRTDYTYDATNGEVTRIQLPAATSGGTRPEIRYAYTQYYAQIRNSSGTLVNTGDPFYRVTQITTCATAAPCAGTATETKENGRA